ncbi:MAG: FtsQ-type POTRA domain-containing protein, partial [Clostridia bacterium]|nr:FtsQ-type POTRA domain-containing protein [Clostridia bacterium]
MDERQKSGSGQADSVEALRARHSRAGSASAKPEAAAKAAKPSPVKPAEPAKKPKPGDAVEKKAGKRVKRTRKRRGIGIAIAVIALCAVLAAAYFVMRIDTVTITGGADASRQYLLELSQLKMGEHVLLCGLWDARDNIEQDPYFDVLDIGYIFPNEITIAVYKHEPIAEIVGTHGSAVINAEGVVLELESDAELDCVKVYGLTLVGCSEGEQLGSGYDFRIASVLSIIEKLHGDERLASIKTLDVSNPLSVVLLTASDLRIEIGQPVDLDDKLEDIAAALEGTE